MPRLRSRFTGVCTRCQRAYEVGDWVVWNPGQGAFHELCPSATVGAPTTPSWKVDDADLEAARRSYDERMKALKGVK